MENGAAEQSPNNTDEVALRRATPEDEAFMCAVYLSTRREEMMAWGWADAQQEMFARMQFNVRRQAYRMQSPQAAYKIILFEGERAGSLIVESVDEEIRLVDIALLPEYRNRGIGSSIIKELFAEAGKMNKPVRLQVEKMNPQAHRLYERLGFSVTGEDQMYFQMEWQKSRDEG